MGEVSRSAVFGQTFTGANSDSHKAELLVVLFTMKTVVVLLALLMICVASKLGPSKELNTEIAESTKEVETLIQEKGKNEIVRDSTDVESFNPPFFWEKAKTARYIVHNIFWGTVSTISVLLKGEPFGTVQSFSDGTVEESTGVPYFFLAAADPVVKDTKSNPSTSLSLSEAQSDYCKAHNWDPELPRCARVTLTGKLVHVGPDELKFAQDALFERHPAMKFWQKLPFHHWQIMRLNITNVWLLDFYGPADTIPLEDYFKVKL